MDEREGVEREDVASALGAKISQQDACAFPPSFHSHKQDICIARTSQSSILSSMVNSQSETVLKNTCPYPLSSHRRW
jgi:hypothetical protein